jgi:hypothetical protein
MLFIGDQIADELKESEKQMDQFLGNKIKESLVTNGLTSMIGEQIANELTESETPMDRFLGNKIKESLVSNGDLMHVEELSDGDLKLKARQAMGETQMDRYIANIGHKTITGALDIRLPVLGQDIKR